MNPNTLPTRRGSAQVLTPASVGTAHRVGKTRKFRKMLLPRRQIKAGGRTLQFDKQYMVELVKAERTKAFDGIALQVHDTHTKDPRYTEGTVSNLIYLEDGPDGDGLYGDVEFGTDEAAKMVEKNPTVGVSVSMVENLVRHEDGRDLRWPAAIQHVLMTTDPHVRGMGAWRPIELSTPDVDAVIDLSAADYEEIEEKPMTAPTAPPETEGTNKDGLVTLEVTPEQRDGLLTLLGDLDAAQQIAAGGRGSDGGEGGPAAGARPDGAPAGPPTELARQDDDAIELMRAEIETERQSRLDLERELDVARAASELDALARTGLAPSIIQAARPLLEVPRGSGSINLSRGETVDPTQVVRNVLHEVIELSRRGLGTISLDQESGMHVGGRAEQAERKRLLDAWDSEFPVD